MNRNELIGTCIGKILGYAVQGVVYAETAKVISPRNVVLLKTGTRYAVKLINYSAKNYVRTDFSPEKIFSDSIDASFYAD